MMKKVINGVLAILMISLLAACEEPTQTKQGEDMEGWEEVDLSRSLSKGAISLKGGKVLEGLTVVGEDSPYYCNLEENMRSDDLSGYSVLVCKDPVYDITYYVNYGRDYYIYAMRDGVSELALELPGRELFCRNGELYFIADGYGLYEFAQFAGGNILKYNPVNGSVEVVVDQTATTMIVYPDGICYNYVGEAQLYGGEDGTWITPEDYFYFSFAEETITPFPKKGMEMRRWRDNYFVTEFEEVPESDPMVQEMRALGYTDALNRATGVNLTDIAGSVNGTLKDITSLPVPYWVSGDVLYYIKQKAVEDSEQSRSVLMTYHLETGEREEVVVLNYYTTLSTDDMLLYNNTLYFGNLLRVSLTDGTQSYAQYENDTLGYGGIDAFYTDGEKVFCLRNNSLWRMEEKKATAISIHEFTPGVPLEIGTYEYYLYPLGE